MFINISPDLWRGETLWKNDKSHPFCVFVIFHRALEGINLKRTKSWFKRHLFTGKTKNCLGMRVPQRGSTQVSIPDSETQWRRHCDSTEAASSSGARCSPGLAVKSSRCGQLQERKPPSCPTWVVTMPTSGAISSCCTECVTFSQAKVSAFVIFHIGWWSDYYPKTEGLKVKNEREEVRVL